jgi:hypothetical protein
MQRQFRAWEHFCLSNQVAIKAMVWTQRKREIHWSDGHASDREDRGSGVDGDIVLAWQSAKFLFSPESRFFSYLASSLL